MFKGYSLIFVNLRKKKLLTLFILNIQMSDKTQIQTTLIMTALNDGWAVKKSNIPNAFEFTKGHVDKKEITIINIITYENQKQSMDQIATTNASKIKRSISEPISKRITQETKNKE